MVGSFVFLLWFLLSVGLSVAVVVSFLLKRRRRAARLVRFLGIVIVGYFAVLAAVSVLSPRRIIDQETVWRFDHWGVAVINIETLSDDAKRVAITMEVSNSAGRARQRARYVDVFLIDDSWQRIDESPKGQLRYESTNGEQRPFTEELAPKSSYQTVRVFDLPTNATDLRLIVEHGVWPGRLIIGSQDSFGHKRPFMPVDIR